MGDVWANRSAPFASLWQSQRGAVAELPGLGTDRASSGTFATAFVFNITSVSRPITVDVIPGAGDVIEIALSSDPAAITDGAHPSWVPFTESSFSRIDWVTTAAPVALRVLRTWGTAGGSSVRITAPARVTLPLDIAANAQNVTGAYSLRRLRTAYAGPVCRVVALGAGTFNNGVYDVTPTGTAGITTATPVTYAGTGPTGAATVGDLLTAGGNNELWVSILYEQMGLNPNMTQATAGNRFKITQSAGVLRTFGNSGRVCMMAPDYLRTMTASFPTAQMCTGSPQRHTNHVVYEVDDTSANHQPLAWNSATATNRMLDVFVPSGPNQYLGDWGDTSGASNRATQGSQSGDEHLRTLAVGGGAVTTWRNDSTNASTGNGTISGTANLEIGGARGGWAEAIVTNDDRNVAQFSLKSDMLAAWGPMV